MKVCTLSSAHPGIDVRIFHKEVKTLVKEGYDVTLIAQHNKNEIIDDVKIIALPEPKNRFYRIFGTTRKVLFIASKQEADVYHFHDPELILVGLVLKLLGAKVIYDIHEDNPASILKKTWIPKILRKLSSIIFSLFERYTCEVFDAVIAAGKDISAHFKNKAITINNYPIIHKFQPLPYNIKAEYIVIYVGGISKSRGILEIVRALKLLNRSDVMLRVYGKYESKELEQEVKKLAEPLKFQFLGWRSPELVWRDMSSADIGIICFHPDPNNLNLRSNKLFEYMAAGLPVIASNFPIWKEIVDNDNCGLTVDPLEPREIAKAIEYLILHPAIAKKMGENGRRAILEKYNWGKESKKLLKVYERVTKT